MTINNLTLFTQASACNFSLGTLQSNVGTYPYRIPGISKWYAKDDQRPQIPTYLWEELTPRVYTSYGNKLCMKEDGTARTVIDDNKLIRDFAWLKGVPNDNILFMSGWTNRESQVVNQYHYFDPVRQANFKYRVFVQRPLLDSETGEPIDDSKEIEKAENEYAEGLRFIVKLFTNNRERTKTVGAAPLLIYAWHVESGKYVAVNSLADLEKLLKKGEE